LLVFALPAVGRALDFTYTTTNGTITITRYTGSGGAVDIPRTIDGLPVASIENYAFSGCTSLTSVTIPDSVTSLGFNGVDGWYSAFYECSGLTAITVDPLNSFYSSVAGVLFDKNQTTLLQYPGGKAGNYTIPSGVASIDWFAFDYCPNLTSVTIPSSVNNILGGTFFSCSNLTIITVDSLNSSYSSVGGILFNKSQTMLIQCPGGKAGNYAVPSSVTSVGDYAFLSCTALISVAIPSSVTSIGDYAFQSCDSLTNIMIGTGVANIGDWAFSVCTNLTGVYFQGDAPSLSGDVFAGNDNVTVYYLAGTTGWPTVPDTWAGRPTALWQAEYAPSISSVSPNPIGADPTNALQTLRIYGANFIGKPTVVVTWTGQSDYTLTTDRVTFVSSSQLMIAIRLGKEADAWTVRVINPDGQSSGAVAFQVLAPGVLPANPGYLEAQAFSDRVELGWTDTSNNETGFKIERRTGTGAWAEIATLGANADNDVLYTDFTAAPRTSYMFRVRAFNAAGYSDYGPEVESVTPGGKPGSFSLSNNPPVWDVAIPGPKVQLHWTVSADVGAYIVYRNGSVCAGGLLVTNYLDSANLASGATYIYFIRASNAEGTTDTAPITIVMPSEPIVTPSISSVSPNPITADADNILQTLTIHGTNFVNKPTVIVTWTGQSGYTLPADRVTFVNHSELTISIRLGREADNWTVKVVNPDGKASDTFAFQAITPIPGSHSPVVSNVRVSQQTGKKLVDIWYDVSDQDSSAVTVSIAMSDNAGTTYAVPVSSCTGDLGSGIVPDSNKHIVWDAGTDWNNHFSDAIRCKITAADTTKSYSAGSNVSSVDTRTAAVSSLTITGPASVIGGNSATYLCTALYADGSQADVSSLCSWSFVGTVPSGAQMYGPSLSTASSFSSQTVQIRATYQRLDGQKVSDPFTVTITAEDVMQAKLRNPRAEGISPGNWDVSAEVAAFGRYGEVQCEWTLDGDVLSGVTGTQLTRYPVSGGVPGTRLLAVHVTDEQNQTATASQLVTFNKPIVPSETAIVYPVSDPVNGKMFNSQGGDFQYNSDRKSVGLIILTHGLTGSGQDKWLGDLATSIEDRLAGLGLPIPNICIYGWEEMSSPRAFRDKVEEDFKWLPVGRVKTISTFSTSLLAWALDTASIRPAAVDQGFYLADWIRSEVAAGHISSNAPIHLIGHSAGGYVVNNCARILKGNPQIMSGLVQATSLDTPFFYWSDETEFFYMAKVDSTSSRCERYYDFAGIGGYYSYGLTFFLSSGGAYERQTYSGALPVIGGHAYSHEWYDTNTANPVTCTEYDGFYYSPFMKNGFHGVEFGQNAQAFALAAAAPVSLASEISDASLTDFETFGAVTLSNGLYQVTEEANAGLFKEIALPVGAQSVKFSYRFATAGDGDYLVVYWGTNGIPLYIGSDLQLSRDAFMAGEAPVSMFAGETNKLTFMLVSRGAINAVLELKDIALTISDDPDYDGLMTSEETALGTDPLNSDTDGDGLSDFDEVRTYFTDPLLTDSDGDGMSDFAEITAGSNPNDSTSCFVVTSLTPLPAGGMRITWQGKTGRQYRVNRCDRLGTGVYTTLATGVTGVEPLTSFDDTQGSSRAFYWVEQEP
jgi:hypothetical protein